MLNLDMTFLQTTVYLIFGVAVAMYGMLDGFDLGVGCLHLFAKTDEDRRIFLNAIGPVWDGNSVWIIISAGALFAGFPRAFATILPAFYLPVVLLLAGFMFRACAIEFRSKRESPKWRNSWDRVFSIASIILAFAMGLIIGNLIYGIPVDQYGNADPEDFLFLNPYSLLIGAFSMTTFILHGALFLMMKTEGKLQEQIAGWFKKILSAFFLFWAGSTAATFIYEPKMLSRFKEQPYFLVLVLASLLSIASVTYFVSKKSYGKAFFSSMLNILFLVLLFAAGTFPYLAYSTIDPAYSLTIYNSSSSSITLTLMVAIAGLGCLFAGFYVAHVYKVFRGKVEIDHTSY